ncbi:helix-turn-helix transcriptional regulator [Streptomyces sp. WMMC500]|uniref:helix-turn-helix domain-containing protein n=1 Tax=Streptomyces sp. WMMC500 TaxID=3015154 RepID=UPI00248CADA5|nr:helix-turn-helix transcriptional regulator [Streptomyces sp. WMMC500]WBB59426.1 helix-turn-helix transcriptional regulator [Streptomyces sp. WMMC500]
MPPRTTPTQRQRRLGAEVKKLRTEAGLSSEYVAGLLGVDRGKISNIETGIRNISPDRLRTLATHCECADDRYLEALVDMAQPSKPRWWDEYRGRLSPALLDIVELEWHATRIQTIQTVHVPGLLQTEDYARSVFAAGLPALSRLEVELRVAHRMDRQCVLVRDEPVTYVGYVHEAALRMLFGGREATRGQLNALIEWSERANVVVRVVPVELGSFPGAGHALLYAEGPVPQLDTAQLDSAHSPEFMHAELQLSKYRAHLQWMDRMSLPAEASRDFIHAVIRDL